MRMRAASTVLIGVLFGFVLSWVGFSDFDLVVDMFALGDLQLIVVFGVAVAVLAPAWRIIGGRVPGARFAARPVHRGTLLGGSLFGLGWAVTGACPSIAFVQVGEGQLAALLTIVGIFAGNGLYAVVHRRFFNFSTGSCLDE